MQKTLQQAPIFQGLSEQELMPIFQVAKQQSYKVNQQLFAEGEPADAFFLVMKGSVRLYRLTPDGKEKVIEIIRQGETFAEAVALLNRPYPVYASAIEKLELIAIPSKTLRHIVEQNSQLALKMLAGLHMRVHKFINDIHALSLSTAQQKVAGYLLAFVESDNAAQVIQLPSKKAIVASRLGLQPETFSRVLRRMKEQGVLQEQGNQMIVLQPKRLRALRDE